jgi:hypothetical protein
MRFVLSLAVAALAFAQGDHSQHSHPAPELGTVAFENSCSEAAQQPFGRGIALLHSFGYEEARLAFEAAAKADPGCAIALWGIARTWYHPIWAPPTPEDLKRGSAALERALAVSSRTQRERDYIEALAVFYKDWQTVDHSSRARAYEKALSEIQARYPMDDEAAIFHALQMVAIGYLNPADKTYEWQKKGCEILSTVLPRNPRHPGVAHYIIHAVDYPTTANLGLKAAQAYAGIAPDSSHALHMPSHIFTRLGLWDDSIRSNIAAAKSGLEQARRISGGGGSFDQLHAMDYLLYAYLQQARDHSAQKVLEEMSAIQSLDDEQFAAAYAFAAAPARWALERHDWKSASALQLKPAWFPWARYRNVEALALFGRAIGAARAGELETARDSVSRIDAIRKELPETRDYDWAGSIGAQWEAASALLKYAEGSKDAGLKGLREAADHEDALDKNPVTPGALLPIREILADLLLENGDSAAALVEYRAVLNSAPRRFNATAGAARAAAKSGDAAAARAYSLQLLEIAANAEVPRPEIKWAEAYLRKQSNGSTAR